MSERSKIYDEIQLELFDDSACVPICYQINVNIHNKAITHYAGKTFGVGLPSISCEIINMSLLKYILKKC